MPVTTRTVSRDNSKLARSKSSSTVNSKRNDPNERMGLRSASNSPIKKSTRTTKSLPDAEKIKKSTRKSKSPISSNSSSKAVSPIRRSLSLENTENLAGAKRPKRSSTPQKESKNIPLTKKSMISSTPISLHELSIQVTAESQIIEKLSNKNCILPDKLPCRESEFDSILEQILLSIQDNQGTCLYISGVPGTGKTATIKKIIQMLNQAVSNDELEPFCFVEINGMVIQEINQAYQKLYEGIFDEKISLAKSVKQLDTYFRTKKSDSHCFTIVLLDELDYLITKKQSLVYNFFEWPSLPDSKLIVIAVANTMDLPERLLSNKVSSRLGMCRINFAPYTFQQLSEIIQFYLTEHCHIFTKNALELIARKICAVSGDARRLLEVTKRAVELAFAESSATVENPLSEFVSIGIVQKAIHEIFSSSSSKHLASLSFHQQLMLVCICNSMKKNGIAEVLLSEVIDMHLQYCRLYSLTHLTIEDYFSVFKTLVDMKLVYSNANSVSYSIPQCNVSLSVSIEDIKAAFQTDSILKRLLVD